jgi:hypothetical protein
LAKIAAAKFVRVLKLPMNYHYISGDSHLEIDSRHWLERVPAKFREQAPRLIAQPDGIVDHFLCGFQFDRVGVEMRHKIGVDRLIWGSDFPHQESDWPDSLGVIKRNFAGYRRTRNTRWCAATPWSFSISQLNGRNQAGVLQEFSWPNLPFSVRSVSAR